MMSAAPRPPAEAPAAPPRSEAGLKVESTSWQNLLRVTLLPPSCGSWLRASSCLHLSQRGEAAQRLGGWFLLPWRVGLAPTLTGREAVSVPLCRGGVEREERLPLRASSPSPRRVEIMPSH